MNVQLLTMLLIVISIMHTEQLLVERGLILLLLPIIVWNGSATGGVDGNTIHMIALTEPAGGTWTGDTVNGLSGALLYYRSQDGGDSWDITDMQLQETIQ